MQLPSVKDVMIVKPKKDGSTYYSAIYHEKKKNPLALDLQDIMCVRYKPGTVFLKNKHLMNYVSDLGDHIVNIVKSNCTEWFNSNMNIDLIDEYFVNPMRYDKEHGYVLKIDTENEFQSGEKYNLQIEVKGLRFLKQKFNIEWVITSIDKSTDIEFVMDDDISDISEEELAEPIPDDLENLKVSYGNDIDILIERFAEEVDGLVQKIEILKGLRQNLETKIPNFDEIAAKLEGLQ